MTVNESTRATCMDQVRDLIGTRGPLMLDDIHAAIGGDRRALQKRLIVGCHKGLLTRVGMAFGMGRQPMTLQERHEMALRPYWEHRAEMVRGADPITRAVCLTRIPAINPAPLRWAA